MSKFIKLTGYYGRQSFAADTSRIVYIQRICKVATGDEFTRIWLHGQEEHIDVVERPDYIDSDLLLDIVMDDSEEEDDNE